MENHKLKRDLVLIFNTPAILTEGKPGKHLSPFRIPRWTPESSRLSLSRSCASSLTLPLYNTAEAGVAYSPSPNHPQQAWEDVYQMTSAPGAATNPSTEESL